MSTKQSLWQNAAKTAASRIGALCACAAILTGCTAPMSFPVTESAQADLVDQNINIVLITPENINAYREPPTTGLRKKPAGPPSDPRPYSYRLGVGDELRVQVWNNPERTQVAGELGDDRGPVVDETGKFFYPFVGPVQAQGRSVSEIRAMLTARLRDFIAEPQVEVAVAQFRAHQATITGAVSAPGPAVLTNVPMRLLDLVNQAGATDQADLSQISIQRHGHGHIVDLQKFLRQGDRRQNPILLPGDLVHVPPLVDNKVFVFGETRTGEVDLGLGRKSLTEILASSGGIDRLRADARGVFVFRRTGDVAGGFDVYQFNLRTAEVLVLTTDFDMAPLDIVFVTNDPITRWNDTVSKLISPFTGFAQAQIAVDALSQ